MNRWIDFKVEGEITESDQHGQMLTLRVNGHLLGEFELADVSEVDRAGRLLAGEVHERLHGPRGA